LETDKSLQMNNASHSDIGSFKNESLASTSMNGQGVNIYLYKADIREKIVDSFDGINEDKEVKEIVPKLVKANKEKSVRKKKTQRVSRKRKSVLT
jgi:hypothetical protein